jgi:hypothetical protein
MLPREMIGTKLSRQVEKWLLKRLQPYRIEDNG